MCKIKDCNNTKIMGHGLCNAHYLKLKRYGDPLADHKRTIQYCMVEGCKKQVHGEHLCNKHYMVKRRGGNPFNYIAVDNRSKFPEFKVWTKMKERVLDKNCKSYKDYGGRGITICDRWLESFVNFITDMGERPSAKHQLDRINNDGNYEPTNCRWVTQLENARNKSTTLKEEEVRRIRVHLMMGLNNTSIQEITGVDRSIISNIKRNHSYVGYGVIKQGDIYAIHIR